MDEEQGAVTTAGTADVIHDRDFSIAVGTNRMAAKWMNRSTTVNTFSKKMSNTIRTNETYDQFVAMTRAEQDDVKDVGGYVGAILKKGRRDKGSVANRQILTFDVDFGTPKTIDRIKKILAEVCFTIASTHKHTSKKPRFRLIVYPDRVMSCEEFVAVSRKVAAEIDIEVFDPGSFETNRLLFWPSTPSDGEFLYYHNDKPMLSIDKVLARYGADDAWKDSWTWPKSSKETKSFDKMLKKAADPFTKRGIVGAFCRVVTIRDAIEKHLGDIYTTAGKDRYTYVDGSSTNGLVIYDEKWAYSNHASDPAHGQLCNAFDILRIHKFGDLDVGWNGKGESDSYKEMAEWCRTIDGVKKQLIEDHLEIGPDAFDSGFGEGVGADGGSEIGEGEGAGSGIVGEDDWTEELQITKDGIIKPTFVNALKIVENDKEINQLMRFDELLVDTVNNDGHAWEQKDTYWVRRYIGTKYGVDFPERKVDQAIDCHSRNRSFHPIRQYLKSLEWDGIERISTLFIDYFGCEDNAYTQEAAKCMLTAGVKRVMHPGSKFDYVVVLGGKQGIGKTTFIRELGLTKWYGELSSFDPKIAMEEICGKWVIEITELSATSKQELEQQKSFLSACETKTRLAYEPKPTTFRRQCIFIGSTNQDQYLKDSTGNRRWWPINISVDSINIERLKEERDMIWAEAYQLWKEDSLTYLSKEAEHIVYKVQEDKLEDDVWKGIIEAWLLEDAYKDRYDSRLGAFEGELVLRDRVCIQEIWEDCLQIKWSSKSYERRRIAGILNSLDDWIVISTMRFGTRFGRQRGWRYEPKF